MSNIPKKAGIILLLLAIALSVWITLSILNYTPHTISKSTGAKESASSGEITLVLEELNKDAGIKASP